MRINQSNIRLSPPSQHAYPNWYFSIQRISPLDLEPKFPRDESEMIIF